MKTALGLVAAMGLASAASAQVFQNLAPIAIPGAATTLGPGSPYPSVIAISGVSGPVTGVRVSLFDMTHTFPDDIDVLLVGPAGQTVLLMSDAGGTFDLTNTDITFEDGAAALPDAALIASGVYAPSNFGAPADVFPAPALAGPYGTSLMTAFGASVNGNWSLFVVDDASADTGSIAGGWQIEVIPSPGAMAMLGLGGLVAARRRR